MNNTKKRRNDIILLSGLLIIGVVLFIIISALMNEGGRVDVVFDGEVVESYSLNDDSTIELRYGGYNLLVIENGTARIDEADCPDKLCTDYRPISKSGETIVCLPHKLVIKISGGEDSELDGIVQ